MARICELWITGIGENSGPQNVDVLWKTNWNENLALPVATTVESTGGTQGRTWTYWRDQYGVQMRVAQANAWISRPSTYLKNCTGTPDSPLNYPYDCINGGCLPRTTYNTPGVYANLAACQAGCAKNSQCDGECVPIEEINALRIAARNLRPRICK